jgi:hypothetical protein
MSGALGAISQGCAGGSDSGLPNVDPPMFGVPTAARLAGMGRSAHAPCILLRYGPLRGRCYEAFLEVDDGGRMKPSAYYDRVVDAMEELFKCTLLTRDVAPYLVGRYSERRESAHRLSAWLNQRPR